MKRSLTPVTIFFAVTHFYFLIEYYFNEQVAKKQLLSLSTFLPEFVSAVYSFITFLLLYKLVDSLFKSRWIRLTANLIFLFLFAYVTSYYFGADNGLDYGLLRETFDEGTAKVMLEIAAYWLDPTPFVIAGIAAIFMVIFEFRTKVISRYPRLKGKWFAAGFCIYLLMVAAPYPSKDEATHFLQTVYCYYFRPIYKPVSVPKDTFPYVKEGFTYSGIAPNSDKPNVFFIIIESFNAWAVDAKTPSGEELTPYFNRLKEEGVYIERFYSHSVLSIKGAGSLFTGILPAIQGSILGSDVRLYSLPNILHDNGYHSMVYHAQLNHEYDSLLKRIGFDDYMTLADMASEEDLSYKKATWGYEDRVLYRHLFDDLDQRHKTEPGPFFATAITVYSHVPFSVPEGRRMLVKDPKTLKEKYYNAIYLSDQSLKLFFEELKKRDYLKNSIVIITGDHGYPVGDHGITWTESGIYDESFRVPFLVVWPGVLKPKHVTPREGVYGQIDFAPTMVDLLNLKLKKHHLIGRSLFSPPDEKPLLLVQPYSGMYLESIRYPYKYIKHVRTGKEVIYNLETDPDERTPLVNIDTSIFKNDLEPVFLNQYLIKHNQIWN